MLTNDQLDEIVRELIYLGVEGEYWDFKEKPYFFEGQSKEEKNKKKNDFLHDIICMANNLSNHDAYIRFSTNYQKEEILIFDIYEIYLPKEYENLICDYQSKDF